MSTSPVAAHRDARAHRDTRAHRLRMRHVGRAERFADIASWVIGGLGFATIVWAFQTPPEPRRPEQQQVREERSTGGVPSEPEELSRWMRRASEGGAVNDLLNRALGKVGPWAKDQKASDNDVPARVPKR